MKGIIRKAKAWKHVLNQTKWFKNMKHKKPKMIQNLKPKACLISKNSFKKQMHPRLKPKHA
jgi:hypothetical protein